ncbi:hypothetical protein ONZ51_g6138 [Trametes cubensis]|uniref:Exonuclease domain-containing protein n=1 Tax=Trametes cubensis TaxID=1111947 RepID=A0AAD7TSP6_9APHY|nr:hypothetical protein ONZ51_g6138 [Trametes cubensis]
MSWSLPAALLSSPPLLQHAILLLPSALLAYILITLGRRLRACEADTSIAAGGSLPAEASSATAPPSIPRTKTHAGSLQTTNDIHSDSQRDMIKRAKQPYDAFLVLDVEATCVQGAGFDYPNEIIEWPVCLLRWKDKDYKGKARELEVVDEFRSFASPRFVPASQLPGQGRRANHGAHSCDSRMRMQDQVDTAPSFPEVLDEFRKFLEKHELIDPETGRRLTRFCFCSDGPYDIRDFVIPVPTWLTWDVMDVRRVVGECHAFTSATVDRDAQRRPAGAFPLPRRVALSIPRQLLALGLEPFEGRQHSGIDDTRNIARLVIELARRGWKLEPNTPINPNRRWPWMGKRGKVLEEYYP